MSGTEGKVEGSPEQGQADDTLKSTPEQSGGQPELVELPDGTTVSVEELTQGYMKEQDYRRKTMELAEQRRQMEAERAQLRQPRGVSNVPPVAEDGEEADPLEIVAKRVINLETAFFRNYLQDQIERLAPNYSDADKRVVFDACWANPNANIEEEMKHSHEAVQAKVQARVSAVAVPKTLEEFLAKNPQEKAKLEKLRQKGVEDYHAKKAQQRSQEADVGGSAAVSGGEAFEDAEKPVASYDEASQRLRSRLKKPESAL